MDTPRFSMFWRLRRFLHEGVDVADVVHPAVFTLTFPWPRHILRKWNVRSHTRMNEEVASTDLVRLDVWLWAARFFKTRSLAKTAIENGKVDVSGQRAKPARQVRVGDALRVVRGEESHFITIAALASKRGSATQATSLFHEDESARLRREQQRAQRAAERSGYRAPEHKPDKRARKLIQALGDIDAL